MNLASKLTAYLLFFFASMFVHGQSEIIKLDYEGKKIPVRVILPKEYSSKRDYPVLIGPGLDNGDLEMGCRYFGSNPERHGWILVESSIHIENRKAIVLLLDYLESNYSIGEQFILGFSANSVDAFNIASIYSERIDGVIGMPGNPNIRDIKKHKSQNILMIVGARDTYWKNRAEKAKTELDKLNYRNKLVVVPKGGHILDELAGDPLFSILNRELLGKTN